MSSLPSFLTRELDIHCYVKKLEGLSDAILNDPTELDGKKWIKTQAAKDEIKFTWNSHLIKKESIKRLLEKGSITHMNDITFHMVGEQQFNQIKTQVIAKEQKKQWRS